jgi:membrane fusion protein, multidrug efflux system
MKRTKRLVGVVLAMVALAAATALALRSTKPQDSPSNSAAPPLEFTAADVVALTARPVVVELAMPGSVQALSQATVRAKVPAEVRAVHVRDGDRVRQGQVLVEFDTAALKAQLAERSATLASARANLAQAQRTRQVNAQLVEKNFISQNAFDNADAALRAQAAAVDVAQAQLAQTQLTLDDAVVRAPIGGHVSRRHVQPGEKAGVDAPLVSIVDLSRLEVQTQAAVSDVARIALGAPAQVVVEGIGERRFDGRVERINPGAEPGTRSINFFVSLPDQGGLLRVGMFATVLLRVGSAEPVPALPLAAIRSDAGLDFVWVLAGDRLRRQPVTLGRRDERARLVQVTSGLALGERVLASRFDGLRDGQPVRLVESTSGAGSAAPDADKPGVRPPRG